MAYKETWSGKINRKLIKKLHIIDVAAGRKKADLVLKNSCDEGAVAELIEEIIRRCGSSKKA